MALGVAIIAWNRPDYLRWLLHSLENQELAPSAEYHLFLDGPRIVENRPLIDRCKRLFDISTLPGKTLHQRKKNVSIAINQFEAREFMSAKYDHFVMLEDDITLSKYALRTLYLLKDYISDDVFSVGHTFLRRCKKGEIKANLDRAIRVERMHWWMELYSSKNWIKIKPHFLEYYKLVEKINYRHRNHKLIQNFFKENGFDEIRTSQDAGMDYALHKAGMARISPVVNRGLYLGANGVHFKQELYDQYEFTKQTPYLFNQDKDLTRFVL